MPAKSRFQITNRGRKGKPCWTLEDFAELPPNTAVGKYVYSSRIKYRVEGLMKQWRALERKQTAENKKEQE